MKRASFFIPLLVSCACASKAADTQPPEADVTADAAAAQDASANEGAPEPEPEPEPEPPSLPFESSHPPGLSPLSSDERGRLEFECPKLVVKLQGKGRSLRTVEIVSEQLEMLAKIAAGGKESKSCIELAERDLVSERARIAESEAQINLEFLGKHVLRHWKQHGDLCPSAAPVPASLDALRSGPSTAPASEWEQEGWACLSSPWKDKPLRHQYEVRTAADGNSAKIIARGFPMPDGEPSELFVVVAPGESTEVSPVMRVGGVPRSGTEKEREVERIKPGS